MGPPALPACSRNKIGQHLRVRSDLYPEWRAVPDPFVLNLGGLTVPGGQLHILLRAGSNTRLLAIVQQTAG